MSETLQEPEKLDLRSHDMTGDKIDALRVAFPEAFTEGGKIDFERLKLALGESVDVGKERYGMNWPGKAECFRTIQQPSMGTLLPCPEESVEWDTTENLIIEGDNLEVLKLLQKAYLGKVKMIYIDPPYNTGNDFIYPDNYTESLQTYLEYTGQVDSHGKRFSTNTETDGRFHSKWLNMMYPRLYLARNLLRDDGVIFISIDDGEVDNLKKLCNEIFGEENFAAIFPWKKRTAKSDVPFGVSQDYEWVMCYTRGSFGAGISHERKYYQSDDYPNDRWRLADLTTQRTAEERPNSAFDMADPKTGKVYPFNPKRIWGVTKDTFPEYYEKGKIVFPDDYDFLNIKIPAYRVFESEDKEKAFKKYGSEDPIRSVSTNLPKEIGMSEDGNKEMVKLFGCKIFLFPKPSNLVGYLLTMVNDSEGLILDFFSGSGTTAHAVLELNKQDSGNRKFILVQLQEPTGSKDFPTIADICKERVRRVIKKLNDEDAGKLPLGNGSKPDRGFKVFKLAESNFKPWNAKAPHDPKALLKQLELHIDHVIGGRTDEDILHEILLKSGFPLTSPVEKITLADKTVYSVASGALMICLDRKLTLELIRAMADRKPERVVCLDEGFTGNDQLKANVAQISKTKNIVFKTV